MLSPRHSTLRVCTYKQPILVAPDDVPAHPYKVAMEVATLAPKASVRLTDASGAVLKEVDLTAVVFETRAEAGDTGWRLVDEWIRGIGEDIAAG